MRESETSSKTWLSEVSSKTRQSEISSKTHQSEISSKTCRSEISSNMHQSKICSETYQLQISSKTHQSQISWNPPARNAPLRSVQWDAPARHFQQILHSFTLHMIVQWHFPFVQHLLAIEIQIRILWVLFCDRYFTALVIITQHDHDKKSYKLHVISSGIAFVCLDQVQHWKVWPAHPPKLLQNRSSTW